MPIKHQIYVDKHICRGIYAINYYLDVHVGANQFAASRHQRPGAPLPSSVLVPQAEQLRRHQPTAFALVPRQFFFQNKFRL